MEFDGPIGFYRVLRSRRHVLFAWAFGAIVAFKWPPSDHPYVTSGVAVSVILFCVLSLLWRRLRRIKEQ